MRLFIDGPQLASEVELTGWEDREGFHAGDDDLGNPLSVAEFDLVDTPLGAVPVLADFELAAGFTLQVREDDGTTVVWRGRVAEPSVRSRSGVTRWTIRAQSEWARALESATGSLNKIGVVDFDRTFLIAMVRDALAAVPFAPGANTLTDAIVAANEPNWPGIKGTAPVAGRDWSYLPLQEAIESLLEIVPGVHCRIRAGDNLVEYGPIGEADAPFGISDESLLPLPADFVAIDADSYEERVVTAGHLNRVRLGGAGAAEETAYDEAGHARIGRVLDAPYENDEAIPASDLRRRAYAKLGARAPRRIVRARIRADGIKAGMAVPVVNRLLAEADLARWAEVAWPISARTDSAWTGDGIRGWLVAQRVARVVTGPEEQEAFELELGDYVQSFPETIAALEAATA